MVLTLPKPASFTNGSYQTLSYHAMTLRQVSDFEALQGEWSRLLARAEAADLPLKHPLEHTWLLTWLRHFPPDALAIILVWDEAGQLLAAAPFKINPYGHGLGCRALRCVQFIGTDPDVYDGIKILMAPEADPQRVCQVIAHQLYEDRHDWDVLDLRYGVSQQEFQYLAEAFAARGFLWELESPMAFHTMALPASVEGYEKQRKRNLKKSVTRRLNRLQEEYPDASLNLNLLSSAPALEEALETFVQLHTAYWQSQGGMSDFKRFPKLKSFYQHLFQAYALQGVLEQRLVFSDLRMGEDSMAYQISWLQEGTLLTYLTCYQEAFKAYGPGTLHIEQLVRYAIARGWTQLNLGRGDEPYKAQWDTTATPLWNLRVFRKPWMASLWAGDKRLKAFLHKIRTVCHA